MRRRLATLTLASVLSWCATASLAAPHVHAAGSDAFAAKASASGVRMTVELPDAPATDTPVDGGGPTAQASLSSVGESIGYAAFPDPGGLVISAPGLIAGLSQSPIAPPDYPLFVSSDATTKPNASAGAGPYALSAASTPTSSRATATGGMASGPSSVGTVSSLASVISDAGRVVSVATTDVTGLRVGPLTIGQIHSTAQFVQDPTGSRTPTSDLELSGVTVGDKAIQVTTDGIDLADGATVPLPIGATADQLLKAQGITVEVLGVSATNGTVVSPALRIRFPSTIPDLGTAIVTMVIGNSVASLTSIIGNPTSGTGSGGTIEPSRSSGTPAAAGGAGAVPGSSAVATAAGVTAVAASANLDQNRTGLWIPPQPTMDISGLYLVSVLALVVVFVVSLLIRLGGVRARWRS